MNKINNLDRIMDALVESNDPFIKNIIKEEMDKAKEAVLLKEAQQKQRKILSEIKNAK